MSTVAVIPVKQLHNAKQRLAGLLSPRDRKDLFTAMFRDVLEAATTCDRIDRVMVVTDDPEVAGIAREFGAQVRPEPSSPGLIAAVTSAAEQLAREEVTTMVFLPADIPLVSVEELEVVLDGIGQSGQKEFMIVPARDLGGSNCVVTSPPDCVEFGFGEDSFRRHLGLARESGVEPQVAKLPGIGLDVDTPGDLTMVAQIIETSGLATNTARALVESGIVDKLAERRLRIG
ncbi:MAG: 2-phospho-L-lactate guanylyltransferase [Pseudomonadales bacterium]